MDAIEVMDNPKDSCKTKEVDAEEIQSVATETAGSRLETAGSGIETRVLLDDDTGIVAADGAIQIVSSTCGNVGMDQPTPMNTHFECGSHSSSPTTHLAVKIINGSPPAAVKSGAPEAAPLSAGSSLETPAILTISLVSGQTHAAPASLPVSDKPVATSVSTAHHDDALQRQHSELSHNKLILRKQRLEISSNNQVLKQQQLVLSRHSDGDSPSQGQGCSKDKSKDKCNKCGKIGHWARECKSTKSNGSTESTKASEGFKHACGFVEPTAGWRITKTEDTITRGNKVHNWCTKCRRGKGCYVRDHESTDHNTWWLEMQAKCQQVKDKQKTTATPEGKLDAVAANNDWSIVRHPG